MGDKHPREGGWRARVAAAPASAGLVGACAAAFVATLGACVGREGWGALAGVGWSLDACSETLVDLGGLAVAKLWLDGAWWRVATAGLLHGSLLHLVLNIWSLWVVGEWAERAWGAWRLLGLFAIASAVGCLASTAWAEAPLVIGASAGIMGIAGALLVARLVGHGTVAEALRPLSARALGIAVGVLVVLGAVVPVIAQAGHLGGLAAGALVGAGWSGRRGASLAWAGLAGLVVGLTAAAAWPGWRLAHAELLGFEQLERGQHMAAAEALERVLAERGDDAVLANAVAYGYAKAGVELERAEALVRQALAEDADNADYVDTLGWVLCRRGDSEGGLEQLKRASALSEGSVQEIEEHVHACAEAAVGSPVLDVSRETFSDPKRAR